jgi:hypothetical protein
MHEMDSVSWLKLLMKVCTQQQCDEHARQEREAKHLSLLHAVVLLKDINDSKKVHFVASLSV